MKIFVFGKRKGNWFKEILIKDRSHFEIVTDGQSFKPFCGNKIDWNIWNVQIVLMVAFTNQLLVGPFNILFTC